MDDYLEYLTGSEPGLTVRVGPLQGGGPCKQADGQLSLCRNVPLSEQRKTWQSVLFKLQANCGVDFFAK